MDNKKEGTGGYSMMFVMNMDGYEELKGLGASVRSLSLAV